MDIVLRSMSRIWTTQTRSRSQRDKDQALTVSLVLRVSVGYALLWQRSIHYGFHAGVDACIM